MTIATKMAALAQHAPAKFYPAAVATAIIGADILSVSSVPKFNLGSGRPAGPLNSAGPAIAEQAYAAALYVRGADLVRYIYVLGDA